MKYVAPLPALGVGADDLVPPEGDGVLENGGPHPLLHLLHFLPNIVHKRPRGAKVGVHHLTGCLETHCWVQVFLQNGTICPSKLTFQKITLKEKKYLNTYI